MSAENVTLVIPVYNEAENIPTLFSEIERNVGTQAEILICYDFEEDNTLPAVRQWAERFPNLRLIKNEFGSGPLGAIRSGFNAASNQAVIVTMADLSDDLSAVPAMLELFHRGCQVVAGSRYMKGGRQIGGGLIKGMMSRLAGLSLHYLVGIPTHDVTNSYRLYGKKFLDSVQIESDGGFELGIELTVKAYLMGLKIGEVPTAWTDRTAGVSRFRLLKWLPRYFRWYWKALVGTRFGLKRPRQHT